MLADGMGSGASLPANARAGKPPSLARMAISPPQLANGLELDCYPHTFSPLLLFAPGAYFDKGYSNYHSVAQFFACVAGEDMLANVLCERRNALYEDLLDDVFAKRSLVTCCIDAHFTAFQVLPTQRGEPPLMVYYDPLKNQLQLFAGDAARRAATFLLLKCHYGDSTHIQEHADHYTGAGGTATRRMIHQLWRDMNKVSGLGQLSGCRSRGVALNASSYFLINAPGDARSMSTQLTGNTCYFQTYLFAVLAKVGGLSLCKVGGGAVDVTDALRLEKTTVAMCQHLLGFFVDDSSKMMRPLTNSNVVVDFFRFREAPYYALVSRYLKGRANVPDYAAQHARLLEYFCARRTLHTYSKFTLVGAMPSAQNTKSLIAVTSTDEAAPKLARSHFYKYRAADLMLGLNTGVVQELRAFCEFNALRKNALLGAFDRLEALLGAPPPTNKFRDYYFMPQYEVGQTELVAVHAHTYALDVLSMLLRHKRYCEADVLPAFRARVRLVNSALAESVLFSTQRQTDYETILRPDEFSNSKKTYDFFRDTFLSVDFFQEFCGLGLSDRNLAEPDVNALTRTVFYSTKLMARQAYKMESDFEKECINQLARTTLRRYNSALQGRVDLDQTCRVCIRVGFGVTYSKYNTLMHFLNVAEAYWHNPDLAAVSLFGKDVRAVLGVSCQKIFFQPGHDFYHYGPFELQDGGLDLAVANAAGDVLPGVSRAVRGEKHALIVTDRVFEHGYLKSILQRLFRAAEGYKLKTDNAVINLLLLSLLLDFGLFEDHVQLLNLPLLASLPQKSTRALQVEVSNLIHEADKRNSSDPVTRAQVEHLIFEVSHKFMVNKAWSLRSREFELVRLLNADPCYMRYVLLVKVYMSLCQINKSAEVDYYKVRTDSAFRILIPRNFSQSTSAYLAEITMRYTFAEKGGFVVYDDLKLFDVREAQPEMNLFKVRIDSASSVQSMVKYVEISNVFKSVEDGGRADEFLVFVADNVLRCAVDGGQTRVRINGVVVEVATTFFNECISFVPCFKYAASEDVIFFCSRNVKYAVDNGGQFSPDYYGMKHELIECIYSEECTVDLNDAHVFKKEKISDLVTESKTVLFFPDFVLQVTDRKQLINLLDYALAIRNVGFFILVLFYLRRASVHLEYAETENKVTKIAGPWREAILYVLDKASPNPHYDEIFARQFSDLHAHADLPLADFVDELCKCFCRYQRSITHDDGSSGYEIVPTRKQKDFLMKILISEECFHFSEVGSGKTKVVLPLLCMAFLSDNSAVQQILARGGKKKSVLVILVPEHLVPDAKAQVYRYCLNLNFRDEYRVYDDIFALLHHDVQLHGGSSSAAAAPYKRFSHGGPKAAAKAPVKQIFVTSFNSFKKALTYDAICAKIGPKREHVLIVVDEVDDFLDRDKLVFNVASNKGNAFDKSTLEGYFECSRAVYNREASLPKGVAAFRGANPAYWASLFDKFAALHAEVQDASRSINKAFGIFNASTLRHCSSNVAQDVEGYRSLIARPYESVNRAMPGSYYSDVERTIYLTYTILQKDTSKFDDLFQEERKFVSFEYFHAHVAHGELDYDALVYGVDKLSELVDKFPATKDGLTRFLYEVILRRMEIRDKSRSVNSIDVVFKFDCIGFTGTPFIDNCPTAAYIRGQSTADIPDLIDRSFYAHAVEQLDEEAFERRFLAFQGRNDDVDVAYLSSDFVATAPDELAVLDGLLDREGDVFNVLVDLCGVFKRSSIHQVRDRLKAHFGAQCPFEYVYHIDQSTGGDRVLAFASDNDVQFDEEFYKSLCASHGHKLRDAVFFFVDNRNVIGKDVPFQLDHRRRFATPLFRRSVVLAHDVDDFSKVWQAMGRSRTMNDTVFAIYAAGVPVDAPRGLSDMKKLALTRELYVRNCDRKMAGNLASAYQTLIALVNLSRDQFYYGDEIVNAFLDRLNLGLDGKLRQHERSVADAIFTEADEMPARILTKMLGAKFSKNEKLSREKLTKTTVLVILSRVIREKFEQPAVLSGSVLDACVALLAGETDAGAEVSYTKQQQQQRQRQQNKSADADTMDIFDRKHQLAVVTETDNYFQYTMDAKKDVPKMALNLPVSSPILRLSYRANGRSFTVRVYPTLQFLYSHHVEPAYVTPSVRDVVGTMGTVDPQEFLRRFFAEAAKAATNDVEEPPNGGGLGVRVAAHLVRANPQYTLAAVARGVYVIGMKDQFNVHDLKPGHPMNAHVQYVADDGGFVLLDRRAGGGDGADAFGPYCVEHYVLMEALSKSEVAHNVLDYYAKHRSKLDSGLAQYDEKQGKGFVCWRFLMNDAAKLMNDAARQTDK